MIKSDWNYLDDKVHIFLMEDGEAYFRHMEKALGAVMELVDFCIKSEKNGDKEIPLSTIFNILNEEMS
jgi:hypothetical protein